MKRTRQGLCRLLCALFLLCSAVLSQADLARAAEAAPRTLKGRRTASFSTGYIVGFDTLEWSNHDGSLSTFFQEVNQARSFLFDLGAESTWGTANKAGVVLLDLVPEIWFYAFTVIPYHEYGHYVNARATGFERPYFVNNADILNPTRFYNPFSFTLTRAVIPWTRPDTRYENRAWLPESFLEGVDETTKHHIEEEFEHGGDEAVNHYLATHPSDPGVKQYVKNKNNDQIVTYAAGLNNQVSYAGDLADKAYEGAGHVTDFYHYLFSKLSGAVYQDKTHGMVAYDIRKITEGYGRKGLSIGASHIRMASYLSVLFSSMTYAYLKGFDDFMTGSHTAVKPFELWGIRMPDLESYILAEGLSCKVKTGWRFDESLHFPIAVEFLYRGEQGAEVTLGVEKEFHSLGGLALGGEIMFGRAFDWSVFVRMPFAKRFFIEASVEQMSLKSFYGQRNIPTLRHHTHAKSFMVRAGMTY